MENKEKFYRIGEFARAVGKSESTLREWEKSGKLIPQRSEANHRVYSEQQRVQILQEKFEKNKDTLDVYIDTNTPSYSESKEIAGKRKIVGYSRVFGSSEKIEEEYELNLLKVYMAAKGYSFQIYKDFGNGIDIKGTALEDLIKAITNGEIEKIVVLNNEKISRFNVDIIKALCDLFDTEIEVIDNTPNTDIEKLKEEALDFISVLNGN